MNLLSRCYAAECYRYCRSGVRSEKKNRISLQRVRYLPGLELRQQTQAVLKVITLGAVRLMLSTLEIYQLRYAECGLNDHSRLELDADGRLISEEEYYPFGGTARWACRSQTSAVGKTLRYGAKERDISGLICYGFRYYVPWLLRWLNPDPAGNIDGLNLLRMCANNPTTKGDVDGRMMAGTSTSEVNEEGLITDSLVSKAIPKVDSPQPPEQSELLFESFPDALLNDDELNDNKRQINLINIQVINGKRHYYCNADTCHAVFTSQIKLGEHLSTHNKKMMYPCHFEGCDKKYVSKKNVEVHYRIHTGEKPYHCDYEGCGKSFRECTVLREHKHTHSDERPWLCQLCPKKFKIKGSLSQHMKNAHATISSTAPLAGTSQSNTQTADASKGLPATRVKCTISNCSRTFKNERGMRKHVHVSHRTNV